MKVLDLLMVSGEFIENKEGVVITFANGKMAKQKHNHYMLLHGLLSDGLKENHLVERIINEEIDDILSFLPADAVEERNYINELTRVVVEHVNHVATYCATTFNSEYTGDRKAFAMKFKNDRYFHFMTRLFNDTAYESLEAYIKRSVVQQCSKLERARSYLRELGFEIEIKFLDDSDG
jgi:hypothetical protein